MFIIVKNTNKQRSKYFDSFFVISLTELPIMIESIFLLQNLHLQIFLTFYVKLYKKIFFS